MAKIHNYDVVIVYDYSKGFVCQDLVNCLVAAKKEKEVPRYFQWEGGGLTGGG